MKQLARLFALLSMFVTAPVLAHSGLVSSTPADRAMVHQSPVQLELQFSGIAILVVTAFFTAFTGPAVLDQ